jgi:hypothetical protein
VDSARADLGWVGAFQRRLSRRWRMRVVGGNGRGEVERVEEVRSGSVGRLSGSSRPSAAETLVG